jgi:hypothetical protein
LILIARDQNHQIPERHICGESPAISVQSQ